MCLRKIIILFLLLFVRLSYGEDQNQLAHHEKWQFSKISQEKIFNKAGLTRDQIIQDKLFAEVIFDKSDMVIQKNNTYFATDVLCRIIRYTPKVNKAAELWTDQTEREAYKKILAEDGVQLQDTTNVYSFLSDSPEQDCDNVFKHLYEIDETIVAVTNEGYLLFFTKPKMDKAPATEQLSVKETGLHGDPLISHDDVLTRINQSCIFLEQIKNNMHQCALSEIENNYSFFNDDTFLRANDKLYLYRNDQGMKAYITRFQSTDYSDFRTDVTLFLEKNNEIKDKLLIYQNQVFAEATTVSTLFYFIDKPFNKLWLLDTFDSYGEGIFGHRWYEYEINKTRGYFKLIKAIECTSGFNQQNNFNTSCKNIH